MVSLLDKSVGKVVESLKKKNMMDNTIILFYSDNGAPTVGMHSNQGSNYPFKGVRLTP
jgi:arylsulfatase B